jgi:hypothetical protein
MIDYEMLCQTIEDWRAGRRPSIDLSPAPVGASVAEEYAEVEAEAEVGEEEDPAEYGDPNEGYAGYEDEGYAYDGAPDPVAGGGTAPVNVGAEDLEYDR